MVVPGKFARRLLPVLVFLVPAPAAAQPAWSVWVQGQNMTEQAAPRVAGGAIFVDVHGIADAVGLTVEIREGVIELRGSDGVVWTTREGSSELQSMTLVIPLAAPVVAVGDALFIDLDAVARISGFEVRRAPETLRADLQPRPAPVAALSGWRVITVPKTPDELEATRRAEAEDAFQVGAHGVAPVLPPISDAFRLSTGLGIIVGADAASEFNGSGRVNGLDTNLDLLLTHGPRGVGFYNGRVTVGDPESGLQFSGGDLVSETRGLGIGAGVSWRAAGGRRPSVSWIRPRFPRPGEGDVVAYRDSVRIGRALSVEGEVASDKAYMGRSLLATRRFAADVFYGRSPHEQHQGGGVSLMVWRGLTIGGATRVGVGREFTEQVRQVFVGMPLPARMQLRLEGTEAEIGGSRNRTVGGSINGGFGPVQVTTRWQNRDLRLASRYGQGQLAQRGLFTSASYAPRAWMRLSLQMATEWLETGEIQEYQELYAHVDLPTRTTVQTSMAVPAARALDRLQVRVTQRVSVKYSVVAEFGQFTAFQAPIVAQTSLPSRVKVSLRRHWNVATPARGASVTGYVRDQVGVAVPGAVVRLGGYQTVTDTAGHYNFQRVPAGSYTLALDRAHLPADYAASGEGIPLALARGERQTHGLIVAPLDAIQGLVYVDRDGNGRPDDGEGVGGVVMRMGTRHTLTSPEGRYAFYNLAPGEYVIEVVQEQLSSDYRPAGAIQHMVQLRPGRPGRVADFRLEIKQKPVIFQQLVKK